MPGAVAAHGEDLWVADAELPLVVRLHGAHPGPGAAAPEVTRYEWRGRILDGRHHQARRLYAHTGGCWITGPDGLRSADLEGHLGRSSP